MEDLTYICTEKNETRMVTTVTFKRTEWGVSKRVDGVKDSESIDAWNWEPSHWSTADAEPMEIDGKLVLEADDDEYEVGRHYAFTPNVLQVPWDDDDA